MAPDDSWIHVFGLLTFSPDSGPLVYEVLVVSDGALVSADHDLPLGVGLPPENDPDRWNDRGNGQKIGQ